MMVSFGLDARSTIKECRQFSSDFERENQENPEAFKFENTPAVQYAIAKAYELGYNEGAGQMTGVYMMDKFEMQNMIKDQETLDDK